MGKARCKQMCGGGGFSTKIKICLGRVLTFFNDFLLVSLHKLPLNKRTPSDVPSKMPPWKTSSMDKTQNVTCSQSAVVSNSNKCNQTCGVVNIATSSRTVGVYNYYILKICLMEGSIMNGNNTLLNKYHKNTLNVQNITSMHEPCQR